VLPELGDLLLVEVRARHIVDLFHKLRTDRERNLAQRTIYNIYSVVAALFRDAKLADLIEQSPCILDERQLGPLVDKDPEWRNEAVFVRDEVETIISDARIPADRQMVYALELLAGVRPRGSRGAALAPLRSDRDAARQALGREVLQHARERREDDQDRRGQAHPCTSRAGRDAGAVEARRVARDDGTYAGAG
jgi:hypothetical protein